jgi:hypothetical protein
MAGNLQAENSNLGGPSALQRSNAKYIFLSRCFSSNVTDYAFAHLQNQLVLCSVLD